MQDNSQALEVALIGPSVDLVRNCLERVFCASVQLWMVGGGAPIQAEPKELEGSERDLLAVMLTGHHSC